MVVKRLKLPVRSLGAEIETPSIERLIIWIKDHRGLEGDLLTYKLEESLRCQEGVDLPAVGGRMYGERIMQAFPIPGEGHHPEELTLYLDQLVADATRITAMRKGPWFSLPAPHLLLERTLGSSNREEHSSAVISAYRQVMRCMRDAGIQGHVLLCDQVIEEELERLSGRRQLLYCDTADRQSLSLLLEYQSKVAVPANCLDMVLLLRNEFEISQVILVDPEPEHLHSALQEYDADSIIVGGYCRKACERYWSQLIKRAEVIPSSPQP